MTADLKGRCPACGNLQKITIRRPEVIPAKVMSTCFRCKRTEEFYVIEQLQETKADAAECPLGVEDGHGSKAKK